MAVEPKSELYRNMPKGKAAHNLRQALAFAELEAAHDGVGGHHAQTHSVMISQDLARRLLQILEEEGRGDA